MNQEILSRIAKVKDEKSDILELNELELDEIPNEVFEIESLKILRLRKNKISFIPSKIIKLKNLIELNLIDNQLEDLPIELFQLSELEALQLRKNNLKVLPQEIEQLKKLKILNVSDNQIEVIHEGLGSLENLSILYLKKNRIKNLPKSFGKLINLKTLLLDDNPFEYPNLQIIKAGLMRIMIFFLIEEETIKSSTGFTFKVPREMKIAVKQYLIYFQEYVEIAKGRKINFEVRSTDDGIFVETSQNDDLEELNEFFNEYLGFVKGNIDDLQPNFNNSLSDTKKELFVLELKQQVHHLKQQIELKNFQLKFLEKQVENYFDLLTIQNSTPNPIYINAISSSSSNAESKAELNSTNEMNLKVELPKLLLEMFELKENLTKEIPESILDEINTIDSELLSLEVEDVETIDKKPLIRIKRIFDQLTDEESSFSKAVKKSLKLKESIQKVGKTYNKVAQWLALPVIPDLLLEI